MLTARGNLAWPAMILAGLALGGYVFDAWPDTTPKTPTANAQPVRATASVDAYLGDLFVYESGPAPLLDILIGAPQPVDAN